MSRWSTTLLLLFVLSLGACLNWGVEEPESDGDADNDSDGGRESDAEADADGDIDHDPDPDVQPDGDADGDTDEDADRDPDVDHEVMEPVITGIDGTGTANEVSPREEDRGRWESVDEGDRVSAPRRISSATRDIVITGSNLVETTRIVATPDDDSDPIEFEIEEVSMERVRATFPEDVSGTTLTALFTVMVITSGGARAEAEVFFLQGQDCAASILDCGGDTCTLRRDLEVEGDITATGTVSGEEGNFGSLEVDSLTVTQSVWLPECPPGYQRDTDRGDIVLCQRALGGGRFDEMVKVGDFWVDRYEASIWENTDCSGERYGQEDGDYPATFPIHGSFSASLYACSVYGEMPTRFVSWFQAQAACSSSGKHLITNAEWQAAVAGTVDPGMGSVDDGACLTGSAGPRETGLAGDSPATVGSCVSFFGVEDMIGNLSEWTSDWWGQGEGGTPVYQPSDFGGDVCYNVDAAESPGRHEHDPIFPAVALRGGDSNDGEGAGAFSIYLNAGPAYVGTGGRMGFRCAMAFTPTSVPSE